MSAGTIFRGVAASPGIAIGRARVLVPPVVVIDRPISREDVPAEIARLVTSDAEGSKKRVEQAMRAHPNDPRAHVQRLADQLATVEDAPAVEPARPVVDVLALPGVPVLRLEAALEVDVLLELLLGVLGPVEVVGRLDRPVGPIGPVDVQRFRRHFRGQVQCVAERRQDRARWAGGIKVDEAAGVQGPVRRWN